MSAPLRWQFKVCLIGDGYVGKTSIRRKYLGSVFKTNYIPTLGVDFANRTMKVDEEGVLLVIWDIAGQPMFQSLRRRYYEGCAGMILVYSVVDRESFDNASRWLVEAHGFLGDLPPLIIAGNKVDLRPSSPAEKVVSFEEGQAFAEMFSEKLNTPAVFIETSALTGENIDDAFDTLARLMIGKDGRPLIVDWASKPEVPAAEDTTQVSRELGSGQGQSTPHSSEFVQEAKIGLSMTTLVDLKNQLKAAESDLAESTSELEKRLLNLKNTIHVKRIMYEHLKRQLLETRQDWADAYEEYMATDKRKKTETQQKTKRIDDLRKQIERIEGAIGEQIRDLHLEMKQE